MSIGYDLDWRHQSRCSRRTAAVSLWSPAVRLR